MLDDQTTGRRETPNSTTCDFLAACIVMLGVAAALGALGQSLPERLVDPIDSRRARPPGDLPSRRLVGMGTPGSTGFHRCSGIGVAFLARTLYLSGSDVIVRPRLQPFSAPPRHEAHGGSADDLRSWRPPDLSASQREMATVAIAEVGTLFGIQALQVDFDATVSQRAFYRDVLQQLRRRLPASMPLSITALASWCIFDDWLAGLPVDEVVPMVFRMGADPTSRPTVSCRRRFSCRRLSPQFGDRH